jgi:hypothetical protein
MHGLVRWTSIYDRQDQPGNEQAKRARAEATVSRIHCWCCGGQPCQEPPPSVASTGVHPRHPSDGSESRKSGVGRRPEPRDLAVEWLVEVNAVHWKWIHVRQLRAPGGTSSSGRAKQPPAHSGSTGSPRGTGLLAWWQASRVCRRYSLEAGLTPPRVRID